jgi:hypothetical protein
MAVLAGYFPAKAGIVFAASPSELSANDSVDWGQFATDSVFASPAAFTSINGLAGTASTDDPAGFFRAVVPGSWASGFLPGDKILNTNSFTYHPITVGFAPPVFGVGAFVDDDLTITGFTASISAYNGDTLLGVFTASGSNTGFGSVPFLGVLDDQAEITKVVFEITNTGSFTPLDMAIGAVALNDTGVAAIPEPAAFLLAGTGLLFAAGLRHYSRR